MKAKGNSVVRFDIGCKDSKHTQAFYSKVFGWKMEPAQHNVSVDTQTDKGIPGSITSLGHEPHQYVMIYVEVASVSETLEEIVLHGGQRQIGPLPTGDGQFFAWVKDPGGNLLGIVSSNE